MVDLWTMEVYRGWFDPAGAEDPSGNSISNNKVDASNLKVPPGETRNAVYAGRLEDSEENLEDTFKTEDLDICFVILDLGSTTSNQASGPLYYEDTIGIQPVIIDRWASGGGSLSANGVILRRRAENEVRRVLRTNLSSGSYGQPGGHRKGTERTGSILIYCNVYEVRHRQYVTNY